MIDRRTFLLASGAGIAASACSPLPWIETTVSYPGMREGHALRDGRWRSEPAEELTTGVVILGSGVAGLTAAWRLARAGVDDFVLVSGPEYGGNAAGLELESVACPRGSHYLPLPPADCRHVREILADLGIIEADAYGKRPTYDETAIVHAPEERLYFQGKWREGLLPTDAVDARERAQHSRFWRLIAEFKAAHGADGRKVFALPMVASSADRRWTALDRLSLEQWLNGQGLDSATLHWYVNYSCRDDYGIEYAQASAWAGLHLFASRCGEAANAAPEAVLTWPDGLNALTRKMTRSIARRAPRAAIVAGAALSLGETPRGAVAIVRTGDGKIVRIAARYAICAMPLYVAARVVSGLRDYGFDPALHLPDYAAWIVSNFALDRFPAEAPGAPLAWDNVVYRGDGLGYVVATHQQIRVAPPARTVFTAYTALSRQAEARRWLADARPAELQRLAACDLEPVYGFKLWSNVRALDITVRGHAMASPRVGFLANKGLRALREVDGRIVFAHSDLSGISLFEEASWWGYRAAGIVLA